MNECDFVRGCVRACLTKSTENWTTFIIVKIKSNKWHEKNANRARESEVSWTANKNKNHSGCVNWFFYGINCIYLLSPSFVCFFLVCMSNDRTCRTCKYMYVTIKDDLYRWYNNNNIMQNTRRSTTSMSKANSNDNFAAATVATKIAPAVIETDYHTININDNRYS